MSRKLLSRYADLIVTHGLNVQPGQLVNLSAEVYHREFLYEIARRAYERGAGYVNVDLVEPRLTRLRVANSNLEQMKYAPSFLHPKYAELVDTCGANLRIVGPEDPDVLQGLDQQKINTGRLANYQAIKYFYQEGIEKSHVHWTVAAAATEGWASRIFKDVTPKRAEKLLWQELFKIARVDRPDYLEEAERHNLTLKRRAAKLDQLQIDSIHFLGPETDLTVGLSPKALFKAGNDQGPRGVSFEPNIPTEECFTTPDCRRTEGYVRTTRPFFINGTLVRNLKLRFSAGEITHFEASEGAETFKEYMNSDPGGKRLGEVALVGIDSPIYRSGLIFEEILLDENAACHIAIGSAYRFCLRDGEKLTSEELEHIGCNQSSVHTDMMISSEEVDVIAKRRSGEEVKIISRGQWQEL